MGILAEILSSKIRAEIFRILFVVVPDAVFHMREIERLTGFAIGTVQTELTKLQRLDIISKIKDGNRVYYRANIAHPLYPEIRTLVLKTSGLVDVIKEALCNVTERRTLNKRIRKLPENVQNLLIALKKDMEANGPIRGDWPNFSALPDNRYHCHLKKGRPTYVAIWEVMNKEIKLIEVTYAGTHEKAPY